MLSMVTLSEPVRRGALSEVVPSNTTRPIKEVVGVCVRVPVCDCEGELVTVLVSLWVNEGVWVWLLVRVCVIDGVGDPEGVGVCDGV